MPLWASITTQMYKDYGRTLLNFGMSHFYIHLHKRPWRVLICLRVQRLLGFSSENDEMNVKLCFYNTCIVIRFNGPYVAFFKLCHLSSFDRYLHLLLIDFSKNKILWIKGRLKPDNPCYVKRDVSFITTVKPVSNGYFQKDRILVFKTNYRLMQVKSSAILSTFIKLPFVLKIFLSIFEWRFTQDLPKCDMFGKPLFNFPFFSRISKYRYVKGSQML